MIGMAERGFGVRADGGDVLIPKIAGLPLVGSIKDIDMSTARADGSMASISITDRRRKGHLEIRS
jgi:hypothetical protein